MPSAFLGGVGGESGHRYKNHSKRRSQANAALGRWTLRAGVAVQGLLRGSLTITP
jgi:hypothetical protein